MVDEPVVVLKFRPEKLGNSVEEKTGMTGIGGMLGPAEPKALLGCEGVKLMYRSE